MRRFYRRTFLNRRGQHGGAYVLADISSERAPAGDRAWLDAELTIADCGRVVTLDFDITRRRDAANALYKARLLRDVLVAFADALEAAGKEWESEGG
jgi:hypothetical protein